MSQFSVAQPKAAASHLMGAITRHLGSPPRDAGQSPSYDSNISGTIDQETVEVCLASLIAQFPSLRRFKTSRGEPGSQQRAVCARKDLMEALRHMGVDSFRSVNDLGLEITAGTGNPEQDQQIAVAVAPYLRNGVVIGSTGTAARPDRGAVRVTGSPVPARSAKGARSL